MRVSLLVFLATAAMAQEASFQPLGTISQLMIDIVYPTSDALFYIERSPPKTDVEWNVLRGKALMLAESGNLLIMPGRARDQGTWVRDAKMLIEVGSAAYKAAVAKDMPAIEALNDRLNTACVTCHEQYRKNYHKKP